MMMARPKCKALRGTTDLSPPPSRTCRCQSSGRRIVTVSAPASSWAARHPGARRTGPPRPRSHPPARRGRRSRRSLPPKAQQRGGMLRPGGAAGTFLPKSNFRNCLSRPGARAARAVWGRRRRLKLALKPPRSRRSRHGVTRPRSGRRRGGGEERGAPGGGAGNGEGGGRRGGTPRGPSGSRTDARLLRHAAGALHGPRLHVRGLHFRSRQPHRRGGAGPRRGALHVVPAEE